MYPKKLLKPNHLFVKHLNFTIMPIIKDPKMNQAKDAKEADFGILYDENEEEYFLYSKGDLEAGNPKRYFTAGTEVSIEGGPFSLAKKYKYKTGIINTKIYEWVEIGEEALESGPVIDAINQLAFDNIEDDTFPEEKELLEDYL
jgi:hypothetical protein